MIKWYWLILVGIGAVVLTVLAFKFMVEEAFGDFLSILMGKKDKLPKDYWKDWQGRKK